MGFDAVTNVKQKNPAAKFAVGFVPCLRKKRGRSESGSKQTFVLADTVAKLFSCAAHIFTSLFQIFITRILAYCPGNDNCSSCDQGIMTGLIIRRMRAKKVTEKDKDS